MLYKLIFNLLFICCTAGYSEGYHLNSIQIVSKSNGIIVSLKTDSLPNENNVSAWQANSGWFYITLYEGKLHQTKKLEKEIDNDIIDFQIIETKESLQIGLKIKEPIENFDFSFSNKNSTIVASLHYSTIYFAQIESDNMANRIRKNKGIPYGIRTWLNITGTGLIISGIVDNESKSTNQKTISGLTILITTFLLDKILKDF